MGLGVDSHEVHPQPPCCGLRRRAGAISLLTSGAHETNSAPLGCGVRGLPGCATGEAPGLPRMLYESGGPRIGLLLILPRIQKIPRLLVGASDGYLYMYNLDPQEGGECTLMKQHK